MDDEGSTQLFVLARIASTRRLIELSVVREIVPIMQLHVPERIGGTCLGVANLRGEIVPVFDVAQRENALDPSHLIVVLQHGPRCMGILVDDVIDVVEVAAKHVVRHPSGLGADLRTVNLQGLAITVFEPEEALRAA